jgi:hypothetical protein
LALHHPGFPQQGATKTTAVGPHFDEVALRKQAGVKGAGFQFRSAQVGAGEHRLAEIAADHHALTQIGFTEFGLQEAAAPQERPSQSGAF